MAGVSVFVGLKAKKVATAIASTPTSKIGEAAPGYVELEGRIESLHGKPLKAKLTEWPCCWYSYKIEEYTRTTSTQPGDKYRWQIIESASSDEPFLCNDGSGVCAIFPGGADVTPTDRSVWYGATQVPENRNPDKHGPGESAEGMMRISGTKNHKFKYTEERLYPNDQLFALGCFDNEVEEDEVKDITSNQLQGGGSKNQPFILSTTPQDKLLEMNKVGSKAAFGITIVPIAIAGILLWLRLA